MVSTHLKNIRLLGSIPPSRGESNSRIPSWLTWLLESSARVSRFNRCCHFSHSHLPSMFSTYPKDQPRIRYNKVFGAIFSKWGNSFYKAKTCMSMVHVFKLMQSMQITFTDSQCTYGDINKSALALFIQSWFHPQKAPMLLLVLYFVQRFILQTNLKRQRDTKNGQKTLSTPIPPRDISIDRHKLPTVRLYVRPVFSLFSPTFWGETVIARLTRKRPA